MNIDLVTFKLSLNNETTKKLFQNKKFWIWFRDNKKSISELIIKNVKSNAWAFGGAFNITFDLYEYYMEHPYNIDVDNCYIALAA